MSFTFYSSERGSESICVLLEKLREKITMDHAVHNKIVSFIWSIADDCLRDVYVRGKYRDVILPMFVLRRLDCLLETTKDAVLEEVLFQREEAGLTTLDTEYFYQHQSLRSLKEVTTEILQLEQETDGLLKNLVSFEEWC